MPDTEQGEKLTLYLKCVREELRGLPASVVEEIIQELRSHVLDRANGDLSSSNIEAIFDKLGDPHQIARINLATHASVESRNGGSLPTPMRRVANLIAMGTEGALALAISALGYGFAISWLMTAICKPITPAKVGLWSLPDPGGDLSLSLGRHAVGVVGHDVLGWWVIPIGLAIGVGVGALTYRYDLHLVRKWTQDHSK